MNPLIARLRSLAQAQAMTLVLGGWLLLWELLCLIFDPRPFVLPAPSTIFVALASDPLWYFNHSIFTVSSAVLGFFVAALVGIVAAIGIVYSRVLEHTLYTLLVSLNSIPKIALAPLFVIWLSAGAASKIAIAATIALWPIVIDCVLGLRSVDPDMIDLSRSMRASPWQIFLRIRLPNALPSLFAGLKVAISMALVGTIAGEFVAAEQGLGYALLIAQGQFKTEIVFAILLLLGFFGTLLFYIVDLVERALLPWHVVHRASQTAELTRHSA